MERKCTRGFLVCMAVLGLMVMPVLAAPEHECATALSLPCNGALAGLDPASDPTPGTGIYGACISGNSVLDSWMTFVPSHSNVRMHTIDSVASDSHYAIYSLCDQMGDPCDSLNWCYIVGCSEDEVGYLGDIAFGGLVPGDTYIVQLGFWGDYGSPGVDTFTMTTECPAPGGICGDGILSTAGDEECDALDAAACQLSCLGDCTCDPVPVPTLPQWGLLGLAALLLGGGAVVFSRLRG